MVSERAAKIKRPPKRDHQRFDKKTSMQMMMIMKRIKVLTILMLGLMLSIGMTSCGSDEEDGNDNGGSTSSKRIVKIVEYANESLEVESVYTYDSEGRVIRVVQTDYGARGGTTVSEITYQYSDTRIECVEDDGYRSYSHTYTLSNGLIVKEEEKQVNNGRIDSNNTIIYTYDSDGYMTSITSRGDEAYVVNIDWKDGNLTRLKDHLLSYSNIPWPKGMFFYFKGSGLDSCLWPAGYWGKTPKYLPSKDSFNNVTFEYTLSGGLVVEEKAIDSDIVWKSIITWGS